MNRRSISAMLAIATLAACAETGSPSSTDTEPGITASPRATSSATLRLTPSPNTVGLPDGWARTQGDGFSIGLPGSWESVTAADVANAGLFDAMRDANPDAAAAIDQAEVAMRAGQVRLFAFYPGARTVETGFAANLNIIHVGEPEDEDLDALAELAAEAVALQVPVNGRVRSSTTTLPAGEAVVLRYEWTLQGPGDQSFDVAVTQYLVVTTGDGYVLTFSGLSQDARLDRPSWEAMAFSFRFG